MLNGTLLADRSGRVRRGLHGVNIPHDDFLLLGDADCKCRGKGIPAGAPIPVNVQSTVTAKLEIDMLTKLIIGGAIVIALLK